MVTSNKTKKYLVIGKLTLIRKFSETVIAVDAEAAKELVKAKLGSAGKDIQFDYVLVETGKKR